MEEEGGGMGKGGESQLCVKDTFLASSWQFSYPNKGIKGILPINPLIEYC